ncbi:MAG TPA: sigma-70 factor domain-containing protein, partial [Chloroflexota bacterium]|nr:sigma-70 factor domain-containing protein [Chloroflexota bacterium]
MATSLEPARPDKSERPDRQDARIVQLLERGRRQKALTQEELLKEFPAAERDLDFFDYLYALFQEEGLEITLPEEKALEIAAAADDAPSPEDMAAALRELENSPLDDPVRMYLREIGKVPLLTAAQE